MSDSLSQKREEYARKKFKQTVGELLTLLRHAADLETVALYWINRFRKQYVLERYTSKVRSTVFLDRVDFGKYFLDDFRDITQPTKLEIGRDISSEELAHYHGDVPARFVLLVPFIHNGETIAVTLLESKFNTLTDDEQTAILAYNSALANVLNTYNELTELSEEESAWTSYERQIAQLEQQRSDIARLQFVQDVIFSDLTTGTVTFLARSLSGWTVISNAAGSFQPLPVGAALQKHTVGYDALTVGSASFSTHTSGNPRRVTPFEDPAEGATLAIPMVVADRRIGLFVIHDTHALSFRESNRHRWSNLIRLLGFHLTQFRGKQDLEEFFNARFGLLNPDSVEFSINNILRLTAKKRSLCYFGMATPAELPTLRTKLSLEELSELQAEALKRMDPARYNINGFLGFHTDYMYTFLLEGEKSGIFDVWKEKVDFDFRKPFELGSGQKPVIKMNLVAVPLDGSYADAYEVIQSVKQTLNNLLRTQKVSLAK
jgi:hypothetical protein